jgi:hypothetical protein
MQLQLRVFGVFSSAQNAFRMTVTSLEAFEGDDIGKTNR